MGYTHYWTQSASFTNAEWDEVESVVKTILETAVSEGLELGDPMGETPATPESCITLGQEFGFNGLGQFSHETFSITKSVGGWVFCKTARKPYDVAVTAILAYLEAAYPEHISVGSDGGPEDWADGIALLKRACGTRAAFVTPPKEVMD